MFACSAKVKQSGSGTELQDGAAATLAIVDGGHKVVVLCGLLDHADVEPSIAARPSIQICAGTVYGDVILLLRLIEVAVVVAHIIGCAVIGQRSTFGVGLGCDKISDWQQLYAGALHHVKSTCGAQGAAGRPSGSGIGQTLFKSVVDVFMEGIHMAGASHFLSQMYVIGTKIGLTIDESHTLLYAQTGAHSFYVVGLILVAGRRY